MGLTASPRPRRRRWALAVFVAAAVPGGLWLWLNRLGHIDVDPSLSARASFQGEGGVRHPDFSGNWKIDLQASESMRPILKAKGRSAFECMAVDRAPITHVIRGDHRRLSVLIKTPVKDQAIELLTDGTPTKVLNPEGTETLMVTRWSGDGNSLVTTTPESANGRPAKMKQTRSLGPDRRTMYIDMEFTVAGAPPICVRRVFRLIALPAEVARL